MGNAVWISCMVCFVSFIAASIAIPIILYCVGQEPRFYIQQLFIPALNNSHTYTNATNLNTSIFMELKFKRVIAMVPIRYHDLNITFYYGSDRSFSVGHGVVPGFSQGRKKSVRRRAVVEARGMPWEEISGGSVVALAVELATVYQLERCDEGDCYYSKGKVVVVAADVVVDGSGAGVSKKAIRLR